MDYERLSTKYLGGVASGYEAQRRGRKWADEDLAVEELLDGLAAGSRVLDVPVGTGRLVPYYKKRGFEAHGLDMSPDMLAEARSKANDTGFEIELCVGDIRRIPFDANVFDLVVCLRFLNWIDAAGVTAAVSEMARVGRDRLLLGIRYLAPFGKLGASRSDMVRRTMRTVGVPRYRAHRWGLVFHDRPFIEGLFERIGLDVIAERSVEQRWDGTDYVFFLLKKAE